MPTDKRFLLWPAHAIQGWQAIPCGLESLSLPQNHKRKTRDLMPLHFRPDEIVDLIRARRACEEHKDNNAEANSQAGIKSGPLGVLPAEFGHGSRAAMLANNEGFRSRMRSVHATENTKSDNASAIILGQRGQRLLPPVAAVFARTIWKVTASFGPGEPVTGPRPRRDCCGLCRGAC